ncbi:MAG: T9SS type A sorting domain-containing protein [Bacteroidetes bacterium]|nr:T9SS type A sorting domain-containing protein [Bacteroidota bacterium]
MKNIVCSFLILFCFGHAFGQTGCCPYLDSIQTYPINPSTTDSIKIVTKTICPGLGNKISYQSSISSDTIFLTGCFYSGMLTAIQEYYDTTTLAPLVMGNYTIIYRAYLSSNQSDCSMKVDSNMISSNLYVIGPSSVNDTELFLEFIIYPNPSLNEIKVVSKNDNLKVLIYDLGGQKIFEQKFNYDISIDTKKLNIGIYIITVEKGISRKSTMILIK